jgi:hypothetical protein
MADFLAFIEGNVAYIPDVKAEIVLIPRRKKNMTKQPLPRYKKSH